LFENRTVDSPEYDSTDVMRLKAQLEAAERELCRLKNAQITTLSNDVLSEVKDALVKSQEDLKIAREREQYLAMELEKTKAIVATLEQGRRIDHIGSLAEVEGLRERMLVLEKEAEESKLKADYELETFRLEADELRDEIQRLAGALADETRRARFEASERMKERIEFDYKLKCSEDQGKHFEETIRKLEEQLAKSENDSGCGTGSNITPDRQVKRRLERSQAIATSTPAANAAHNEIRKFEQELNEKNEQQSLLQDELDVVNEKLRLAEATVSKTHELANFRARESLARSTRLERGVGTLKTIFEVSSQSDSGRDQHRTELTNLREREKTLENEMLALQSKLNASEARVKHEMFRAEEERRMAIETDAERIAEIDRLKAELRRTKEKMTSHEVTMETGNAPMNYRESQLSPNQDSKKIPSEPRSTENNKDTEVQCNIFHMEADRRAAIESDSERLAEIDRLKEELTRFKEITPDADEIVHAQKLVGMQQHKDAACYDDRDSLILDALHAARKYVNFREQAAASASEESNGQGTPSKSPTRRSKWNPQEGAPSLAWSSDSSSSSFKESGSETTVAVENLKSPSVMDGYPCISSPESMLDDFSGNAVPTPPSSPPRLKFLSSPPSKGTFLSMVDEEKVVSSGVPTSVTTRLDEIQRRLLQSNERLSAAKSKLKDLAATSEVNKSEQMMLKSHVDEILEAIAQQTKRAMQSSPPQPSPPPKATYNSSSSPDRSIRNRDSTSSPSTNSRNIISNTEKVLERYRKYKASQLSSPSSSLENSPNRPVSGRLVDVLDDEAEI
jgi:chromosome segregation ATPase